MRWRAKTKEEMAGLEFISSAHVAMHERRTLPQVRGE